MNKIKGFEDLHGVLADAYRQCTAGKGEERHGSGKPFAEQPMQKLCDAYGRGFALGQAAKKTEESQRLAYAHARAELLGAIVYIAGAIVHYDREIERQNTPEAVDG